MSLAGRPSVLILYASTSGSTRLLVSEMLNRLGPKRSEACDLSEKAPPPPLAGRSLVVLATPTYGIGDCHSSWTARGPEVLSALPRGATVALLCLGDARGHRSSFAGGLDAIERLVAPRNPRLVGHVSAADYDFEASPALRGHLFPGLPVEYRRDRRLATRRALEWLEDLVSVCAVAEREAACAPSTSIGIPEAAPSTVATDPPLAVPFPTIGQIARPSSSGVHRREPC